MTFLLSNSISFLKCFKKYSINTPLRVAHFLAQLAHESDNFTSFNENLNYRPENLLATFNKKRIRITKEQAYKYSYTNSQSGNKEMIANIVYAGVNGNGNVASGDGFRFRGRGIIQLTGRANYEAYKKYSGIDVLANPNLASTPSIAIDIAGWFWYKSKINVHADNDNSYKVSALINNPSALNTNSPKSINGLLDRQKKLNLYKQSDTIAILKKKIKPIPSKSPYSSGYGYWDGIFRVQKNKFFPF